MQLDSAFQSSSKSDAYVGSSVTGYSSGSLIVAFQLDFDESKLSG